MSDSPWKPGRKFQVTRDVIDHDNGRAYRPGVVYEVAKFGMIRMSEDLARARHASQYWQSTEEERYRLLQYIVWEDSRPSKISNGLRRFIEQSPTSKFVRGFVRQEMGIVPPKDQTPTTSEGWLEFIDKTDAVPIPSKITKTIPGLLAQLEAGVVQAGGEERRIGVEVVGTERVFGSSSFNRTDDWSGIVEVPISVIQRGAEAVHDYIRDYYSDWLDRETGDSDTGDENVEGTDGLNIEHTNIETVIAALEAGQLDQPDTASVPAVPAVTARQLRDAREDQDALEATRQRAMAAAREIVWVDERNDRGN